MEKEIIELKGFGIAKADILEESKYRENANMEEDYQGWNDYLYGYTTDELAEMADKMD